MDTNGADMRFHADLHIHSKYSRATSRDLDLEHLAHWAARKGIAVVGTGDFTHPAWIAELKQKLVPAEPGLFRLRPEIEREVVRTVPAACQTPARFMLSVEISTIYKKGELTRKIHHLLYAPDFATADRIATRLARIGNIASDGRPILGLDSRHLLEIVVESDPGAYLIPAHIWTPWFAALGSRSGFDSITECYGDLADHIFAVETGLSSDPAMNWRLSQLDRYRLVSNSDAHSPGKLGRETTVFDTPLDYFAIYRALETGDGYVGTVEFFPEEGKYHLDGHRKCGIRLTPRETLDHDGRCPACGQPVTIGVLHRVEVLADRAAADTAPPPSAGEVTSLVPLPEILGELAGSAASSKTVQRSYDRLVTTLGAELSILTAVPVEELARTESDLLAEAISRLRAGQVIREAGYDGEYGVIRLFDPTELRQRTMGGLLFEAPVTARGTPAPPELELHHSRPAVPMIPPTAEPAISPEPSALPANTPRNAASSILASLDDDQRRAAATGGGALLIIAGPGSGKTRTLTHRIAHLIAEHRVSAAACLAITFTRRAAAELRERLAALVPAAQDEVAIHTFHSFGLAILRAHSDAAGLHRGFRIAGEAERTAALVARLNISEHKARSLLRAISVAKRTQRPLASEAADVAQAYEDLLAVRNWIDFDDLVRLSVRTLTSDVELAAHYRDRFRCISVDEFQDVDEQQYRLLTLLAPPGADLCVIGDPDQAIYGFRGADASCFDRFRKDYPAATVVRLARNYRSSGAITAASSHVITAAAPAAQERSAAQITRAMLERVTIHTAPTERAEAEFVVHTIEQIIGGHNFFSIDTGRTADGRSTDRSFADFAVLYRTDAQSVALCEALARSGMPFQRHGHALLVDHPAVRALLEEFDRVCDAASGGTSPQSISVALETAAAHLAGRDSALDAGTIQHALAQLAPLATACGADHTRFTDAVAVATDADAWDPRADRVSLLTMHAAKGLEFPVVFIAGLEDGVLPLAWGNEVSDAAMAEERRLFYVGMTRAKDRLILSHALKRAWRGRIQPMQPSPFLRDIANELLQYERSRSVNRKPDANQLTLL